MTGNAIEAVGLSKRFLLATERRTSLKERLVRGRPPAPKTFWALKDATFAVPRGSSLGIIGHNGSGKSTALKVLTGIYRPTSGTVKVNGSVSALLEVGAGFHPELTGRENIRLNATILGFTNREIDRLMDRIIEFADIGDHIDAPLKHYSSGMYVRLGFAIAVMVRPEILIVDEVIAVGDEEFQRKCFDYLYDLRRAGTSMIIVSHGLGQITDLCDEALCLEQGHVREFGPARQVVRSYLDDVNSREALRSQPTSLESPRSESPGSTDPASPARRGSGEIRVLRVELLDPQGDVSLFALSGQPLRVRMHYIAHEPVSDAVFELDFVHESGVLISGPRSARAGGWHLEAGSGHVDFFIPALPLLPGAFTLSSSVFDRGHTYDFAEEQATLKVRSGGEEEPGLARVEGSWTISHEEDSSIRSPA